MQCAHCKRESVVKLAHMKPYCKHCFCEVIEKRVRKDLRITHKIKAHQKIIILADESKEAVVSEFLIKSIAKKIPLDIKEINSLEELSEDQQANARIIIPTSATIIAEEFLDKVFNKQHKEKNKLDLIPLLSSVSEEEILTFANFKNLKFKERQRESATKSILKNIEEHYSGSTFGIIKSKQVLEKKSN